MDWIVIVLIIIGIVSRSNKKKKQTRQRQQKAWQNASAAMDSVERPKGRIPPKVKAELSDFVKELGTDALDNGIPSVTEAVREIRSALPSKKPPAAKTAMPKKAAPRPEAQPSGSLHYQPAQFQPMAAQRLQTAQPEGETHEEHAAHVARIRAVEKQQQAGQTREAILRGTNLRSLRAAVVMSEVLGKPVSMRPNGRFR